MFVSDAERRGGERELLAATVRKMPRVLHRRSQPWTSGISVQGLRDVKSNVADPDPDLHVFGPHGSGSGSASGSFYHHAKIVRKTLIPTIL